MKKSVHEMPFGAAVLDDGKVGFRLWAPAARTVELCLEDSSAGELMLSMTKLRGGWFQCETAPGVARHGTLYRYCIDGDLRVPDPASRSNPFDVHGPSQVVDAAAFVWQDGDWPGRPWQEAVIYELHVGAFTAEGNFAGVERHLDYLLGLGVTAIELMPIADFPGARNWGYDGVLLFAPDHRYGTPDELKRLVQAAHQRGLMVLLDVVYNHFGPDGNYLHSYAPQFFNQHRHTPWGAAINFDGDGSRTVRDFFIHNALYWLEEYHFDGLRLDAVHAIIDETWPDILEELSAAVQSGPGLGRRVYLLLENDANSVGYLKSGAYTAQWNDDFHHVLHLLLSGERDGYYADYADSPLRHLARCLSEGFAFQGEPSVFRHDRRRGEPSRCLTTGSFINFIQTHDQIGNRAYGERIAMLSQQKPLHAALAVLLLAPPAPMLFMGEEFAAATPFQFFCDFQGELASAVTEGRRREFAGFAAFAEADADHTALAGIPDPNDPATFRNCKLNWDCLELLKHQVWLEHYRHLLALRHAYIAPRLPAPAGCAEFELPGASGLMVNWRLSDGSRLILRANLGDAPVEVELHGGTAFYLSQADLPACFAAGFMPPWSVAWFLKEAC